MRAPIIIHAGLPRTATTTLQKTLFPKYCHHPLYTKDTMSSMLRKNEYDILGNNSRLDGIQAAVLNVKLKYLNDWIIKRQYIANQYTEKLKDSVITPVISKNTKHAFHLYVIRTKFRDKLINILKNNNIDTRIHYPIPVHQQKIYVSKEKKLKLPVTERIVKEILSIPIFPEMSKNQINFISSKINENF